MMNKMKKPHKYPKQSNSKEKERQLQAEWEALLSRHAKPLERGAKSFGIKNVKLKKSVSSIIDTKPKIPSAPDTMVGIAAKAAPKIYTGTKIVGIAVMHKSNLVPIFNDEAAVEVAQMRRN